MDTLPKISNENQANRFIITSMKAINDRKIEQANFYENILDSEGTLREADKKWREFKRKTPMLSESLKNKETGLPMFFNDFFKQAQAKNPKASRGEIIKAWRDLNE
jgi:DNA polymerase IIIc chi subunit